MTDSGVRRAKAGLSSGCKSRPATAPAGSNRSSHGGTTFQRMAFGNNKIKADFGGERITDRNSATAFMLILTAIYRNKPHWKLADQALRQASKSAAAESRACATFKAAIEAKGCWKIDVTPRFSPLPVPPQSPLSLVSGRTAS
jgi:hypothetical protein